jgi:hypothetical protein
MMMTVWRKHRRARVTCLLAMVLPRAAVAEGRLIVPSDPAPAPPADSRLVDALDRQDLVVLEKLLLQGVAPTGFTRQCRDRPVAAVARGRTLLSQAVERRDSRAVKLLLRFKSDARQRDLASAGGRAPLIHAAGQDALDIVLLLLDAGADIATTESKSSTRSLIPMRY